MERHLSKSLNIPADATDVLHLMNSEIMSWEAVHSALVVVGL